MPKDLDDAFEITMARMKQQADAMADQAMEVLNWILLTKRDLRVPELQHALAVAIEDTKLDWDNFPPEDSLAEVCLGLVIHDKETSTIRLVHRSLFEYLKKQHQTGNLLKLGH